MSDFHDIRFKIKIRYLIFEINNLKQKHKEKVTEIRDHGSRKLCGI